MSSCANGGRNVYESMEAQLANRNAMLAEKTEQFHELNARIEKLMALNGELCAEVNEKDRRITELVALLWQAHNELLAAAMRSDGVQTWQAYEFNALRPGERARTCSKCGKEFAPSSRPQRFCPECGAGKKAEPRAKKRRGALVRETREGMDNNLMELNRALFRELDRIEACGNDAEAIEIEGMRADRVCDLAANIVATGKLALRAAQMTMGVAEAVEVPKVLLGAGDGR